MSGDRLTRAAIALIQRNDQLSPGTRQIALQRQLDELREALRSIGAIDRESGPV